MKELKEKLNQVPDAPGVYLFKDSEGKVIYVGKAKSLKDRLSSHLSCTNPNEKSYLIVKNASDFEYIVVKNERDALILEAELIKKYLPKFNVLLKDDKSYPYLLITDEDFPTIRLVRKADSGKGERFGPFIPAKNARVLKELLHKIFRLRKCKNFTKRTKPCLQYYMERCTAPCAGRVSKEEYMEQVKGVLEFLRGNVKRHIQTLYAQIEEASEKLEFEKAAILRDQLIAIKNVYEKGWAVLDEFRNCDAFYIEKVGNVFSGIRLVVRNSIVYGKKEFIFDPKELFDDAPVDENVVGTLWIKAVYSQDSAPEKIFANFKYLGKDLKVESKIPEKILKIVRQNKPQIKATYGLEKIKEEFEKVFLDEFPERIEVYDISTLFGTSNVGACIVWENGSFVKNEYRRFRIKSVDGIDDYACLEEVLTRRFKRIKNGEVKEPDLILIDGGLGQLNVAIKLRDSFGIGARVFSIAKREEIVYTDEGEVVETKKYPNLFRFFTSLRDEAHRFAVSYNRKLRSKGMLKSVFDGIKGLGEKRKNLIEKFYPDPVELANAGEEELVKIGIPKSVAREVIERAKSLVNGGSED